MRTTVDLDDDVLRAAKALARARRQSLGTTLSELARNGLPPRAARAREGFPVFDVPTRIRPLTPDMVSTALDDHS